MYIDIGVYGNLWRHLPPRLVIHSYTIVSYGGNGYLLGPFGEPLNLDLPVGQMLCRVAWVGFRSFRGKGLTRQASNRMAWLLYRRAYANIKYHAYRIKGIVR